MRASHENQGQWNGIAGRWDMHGPPLRPSPKDVALYQQAVNDIAPRPTNRALILGVTPELYGLRWPDGVVLKALDRSSEMIDTVWPGNPDQAILGDWGASVFEPASLDFVVCDGGLHLLDYPAGQTALADELANVVLPGGHVVFRLFLPPERRESPDQVLAELITGKIRDMNCLKLRLGHAMCGSPEEGVKLGDVWQFLHAHLGDRDAFFTQLGWDHRRVAVIDLYRDSPARYHFADLETVKAVFGADRHAPFEVVDIQAPDQLMGDQCVHLRLRRV